MALEEVIRVAVFDKADLKALNEQATGLPDGMHIEFVPVSGSYGKSQQAELVEAMQGFNGAVVRSGTYFREALEHLPQLKFVGRAGIGVDNIDDGLASKMGVIIYYAPDSNSISVVEQLFAQLLELERGTGAQRLRIAAGESDGSIKKVYLGHELYGKIFGVVGVGNIGSKVVSTGLGFGTRFILYDPVKSEVEVMGIVSEQLRNRGLSLSDNSRIEIAGNLDQLLGVSDFVTVHLPLQPYRGFVNSDLIGHMKDDSILINNSRAGIVNERDVRAALDSGKLRGYISDVRIADAASPLYGDLQGHPQVLFTSHTCANTREAQYRASSMVGQSIAAYVLSGGRNIIWSYNTPTMDDSLKAAYNLTRILSAFATKHLSYNNQKIESVRVFANGLSSYNRVAISMAAAAGTAFGLSKLNGNNDLPAASIIKDEGIELEVEEVKSARIGMLPQISLEYQLSDGSKEVFSGQIAGEGQDPAYSINSFNSFTGKGTFLIPTEYVLVDHEDVRGSLAKVSTEVANQGLNIIRDMVIIGSSTDRRRSLMILPVEFDSPGVARTGPENLLARIRDSIGGSAKVSYVDLRSYSHSK